MILAGIGAFDAGMSNLAERGLIPILRETVLEKRVPVLGICLGMQLLMSGSEEGVREGLGWIAGKSVRVGSGAPPGSVKVPHMGWNVILVRKESPLLAGLAGDTRFYFAHSFAVECDDESDRVADTVYGSAFPAVVVHGHVCGVQFHPEKSHRYGRQLLKNFAAMEF